MKTTITYDTIKCFQNNVKYVYQSFFVHTLPNFDSFIFKYTHAHQMSNEKRVIEFIWTNQKYMYQSSLSRFSLNLFYRSISLACSPLVRSIAKIFFFWVGSSVFPWKTKLKWVSFSFKICVVFFWFYLFFLEFSNEF